MNNQAEHNPWGRRPPNDSQAARHEPVQRRAQSSPTTSVATMPAAYTIGSDFAAILSGFAGWSRRARPHVSNFSSNWASRTRGLWGNGSRSGKLLAALSVATGLVVIVFAAYLIAIILPLILLGAIIAAVLTNIGKR